MADEVAGTLASLAEELLAVFHPLTEALASPEALIDFLDELGWAATEGPQPLADLAGDVTELVALAENGLDPADVPVAIAKIARLAGRIRALATAGPPPVTGAAQFLAEFPEQLVRHLLAEHLLNTHPELAAVLRLVGVLVVEDVPAAPPRVAYRRTELLLGNLPSLLGDPLGAVRAAMRWGQDPIAVTLLAETARSIGSRAGLQIRTAQVPDAVVAHLSGGAGTPGPLYRFQTRAFLFDHRGDDGTVAAAGFGVAPAPPTATEPPGIVILPFASAALDATLPVTEDVRLVLEAEAALDGGDALVLRPGRDPQVVTDIGRPGGNGVTGGISFGFEHGGDRTPAVLIGEDPGSRIEYTTLSVAAGGRIGAGGVPSAFVRARLTGSALVISPGADADSFLTALLPPEGFRLGFDLEVELDSVAGLSFSGGAGLEIRYPTHVDLGPLRLEGLTLALRPAGGALALDAGADVTGRFGPLSAAVENIGFSARLDPGASQRNLGVVDLALGFKPPAGVGLAIDAGVVSGGGYLFLDPAKGEYAGVLELSISGLVSVTAIGLITTRQPDGTPGFSLLLVLTAEFVPGLQLGFGFALVGVGGLVGLNRTVRLDVLAERISTGAAQSVLFPRDVVANAPRILSDLRAIFPPKPGTLLIGPMAKLGWGTPTLVSLSLGVIIEIPGNIGIVGVLQVALPTEDAALVLLRVSFVGAIEFDRKRVWFFASLVGSRVLVFPIDGELGVLMAFGADATFVLSVGGFHPRFSPPPLPFPAPRRIGITILQTPLARISAQGYLAVTSNTVQFGARAELMIGFDSFGLSGHIAFDALFRFSPFAFEIDASASMSLKAFGVGVFTVRIELTLSGPAPWRARGRGSISLFFFDISADFDITWGDAQNTLAPPVAVLPLVRAELMKADNWTAELPAGRPPLVSLRPAGNTELVLHPLGVLRVSQRAVPLGVRLDKIGAARPSDVRRVIVEPAAGALTRRGGTTEQFAMAQFQDLPDAERLSRRAFEPQDGGVLLAGTAELATSRTVRRTVRYEQILIDTFYRRPLPFLLLLHADLFARTLAGSAVTLSGLSAARERAQQPFAEKITVQAGGFVVASTATNTPVTAEARFDSEAQALEFLAARPGMARIAHVIPAFEAA